MIQIAFRGNSKKGRFLLSSAACYIEQFVIVKSGGKHVINVFSYGLPPEKKCKDNEFRILDKQF